MNLIVFDLEWNIGYQPKTFLYHGTELTLRGEIIQIGAARINDRGDVLDTFEVNLKPHIFRKLQHHIAKVTGLSQGDLDAGLPMKAGISTVLSRRYPMSCAPPGRVWVYICMMDSSFYGISMVRDRFLSAGRRGRLYAARSCTQADIHRQARAPGMPGPYRAV